MNKMKIWFHMGVDIVGLALGIFSIWYGLSSVPGADFGVVNRILLIFLGGFTCALSAFGLWVIFMMLAVKVVTDNVGITRVTPEEFTKHMKEETK